MEFHHRDPRQKCFQIASAVYRDFPLEVIRHELAKCDPLCATCHKIVHAVYDFEAQPIAAEDAWKRMAQREAILNYRKGR